MRFVHFFCLIISIGSLSACKSRTSELKATQEQRNTFKGCIVSTIMESFAETKPDIKAVNAFADDMVQRAPSENDKAKDAAFEEYVGSLGCDPNKVESKNRVGTMLVAEWTISSFNPSNSKNQVAP